MQNYVAKTYFLDYASDPIQNLIAEFKGVTDTQLIIRELYLKIRDGWRYNPFTIGIHKMHYVASSIAQKKEGHCIDKAILYTASLRGLGIPARIRLAKVANHIATERLEAKLGTNHLTPHGLVDVYFNGKWLKCSPAFNKELCEKYKVVPLDFDGTYDSVFQEYNSENQQFMSYLEDYGTFSDVPYEFILNNFKNHYPDFYQRFEGKNEVKF